MPAPFRHPGWILPACTALLPAAAAAQCPLVPLDPPASIQGGGVQTIRSWDPDGSGPAASVLLAGLSSQLVQLPPVVVWDGSSWAPLGTGLASGWVAAFTEYQGQLIAGGTVILEGQNAEVVAWNGQTWSAFPRLSGDPFDLGLDPSGNLVAATAPIGPAYRWTGSSWQGLGTHTSAYGMGVISYGGDLIVGGAYQSSPTSTKFVRVGRWTGTNWEPLGSNSPNWAFRPYHFVIYQNDLIVTSGADTMRWDGSSWHDLNWGDGADLIVYNGDLYAASQGAVARYTGAGWDTVWTSSIPGFRIVALTAHAGDLIIAGVIDSTNPALSESHFVRLGCAACYPNCDASTIAPVLNVNDFICFQSRFAAGDPYANCDQSTTPPILNVNDFICFQTTFAAGCP